MVRSRNAFSFAGVRAHVRWKYFLISFAFLAGILAGYIASRFLTDSQCLDLRSYMAAYLRAGAYEQGPPPVSVAFSYFRAPAMLVLLGLSAYSVWLVPAFLFGQGFLLSFSLQCLTGALGFDGVRVGIAAFGLRCLFVIPCSFILAVCLMGRSPGARGAIPTFGKREAPRMPFASCTLLCGLVLSAGCVLDISLSPRLFSLVFGHMSL